MRRHSRHHYRLGAPEVGTDLAPVAPIAPAAPSMPARSGGGLLTPKTGNLLVGAGLLTALGVLGYYVYKGGDIADLWSRLFPKSAEEQEQSTKEKAFAQQTGPLALYTPPSSIEKYIPRGLTSGQGGDSSVGVSRPTVDMYY